MEAYKTTCNTCGFEYFWVGYKTRPTEDQDKCQRCGSKDIVIGFDMESEAGLAYQESTEIVASIIAQVLRGK